MRVIPGARRFEDQLARADQLLAKLKSLLHAAFAEG